MPRKEYSGIAGTAFQAELPPPDDRPNRDTVTQIARWNLTLPGQHAFWSRYTLILVHLRDCAGITPAVKESINMTHELTVFAIDPEFPEKDFQDGSIGVLEPVNHVVQFEVTNADDRIAYDVAEQMVKGLVDGQELVEPSGIIGARDRFTESVRRLASYL